MTTFDVKVNDEQICIAGIDSEAGVLTGIVSLLQRKGAAEEINLIISGQDSVIGDQYTWNHVSLKAGDEITIKIGNGITISEARKKTKEEIMANEIEAKLRSYYRLKEELKDHIW